MDTSKPPSRLLDYLGSTRNIVGSVAGLVALGATVPTGVSGEWWPVVVGGVYGIGALLTPGPKNPQEQGPGSLPRPQRAPRSPRPARPARSLRSSRSSGASGSKGGSSGSSKGGSSASAEGTSALLHDNSPGGYGSWLTNQQILPAGREGDLEPPDRHENPSGRRA